MVRIELKKVSAIFSDTVRCHGFYTLVGIYKTH